MRPPFVFDQLGVRVPAVVVSPYVRAGVDHTLFDHASIPATVTQQFIGPPREHAPFLREKNATPMLGLLAPISPRDDWPSYTPGARITWMPTLDRPASALQLEHAQELHAALTRNLPDVAGSLDPLGVKTKKDAAAFVSEAMTALHERAGYA